MKAEDIDRKYTLAQLLFTQVHQTRMCAHVDSQRPVVENTNFHTKKERKKGGISIILGIRQ